MEETVKTDKMKRVLGGKHWATDEDLKIVFDQANGRIMIFDSAGDCRTLIGNLENIEV